MEKITIKLKNIDIDVNIEYYECIKDIIVNKKVLKLDSYKHHYNTTTLEHSIKVSILNYKICKFFKLDYISAARAGMLHDFFLYSWKNRRPQKFFRKHGFLHSRVALKNSLRYFNLNDKEKDIILKHMWPLNIDLPKYKETIVIIISDKIITASEIFCIKNKRIK